MDSFSQENTPEPLLRRGSPENACCQQGPSVRDRGRWPTSRTASRGEAGHPGPRRSCTGHATAEPHTSRRPREAAPHRARGSSGKQLPLRKAWGAEGACEVSADLGDSSRGTAHKPVPAHRAAVLGGAPETPHCKAVQTDVTGGGEEEGGSETRKHEGCDEPVHGDCRDAAVRSVQKGQDSRS